MKYRRKLLLGVLLPTAALLWADIIFTYDASGNRTMRSDLGSSGGGDSQGDYNDDGREEVLVVEANSPSSWNGPATWCYLIDLQNDSILYQGQPFEYNVKFQGPFHSNFEQLQRESDLLLTFDYDGDGCIDVCHVTNSGMTFYTFEKVSGGIVLTQKAVNTDLTRGMIHQGDIIPLDLNAEILGSI